MNYFKRHVIITSAIVLSASCTKEPFWQAGRCDNGAIGVKVSRCNGLTTKSGSGDGECFDSFAIDSIGREVPAGSTATLDFVNTKYESGKLPNNAEAIRN